MSGIEPPELPEPEDDPAGYANYLRRKVVALARQYFLQHGNQLLRSEYSYGKGGQATLEDVGNAIFELDEWKREFDLADID